jgi:hypothetical protein
LRSSAAVQKPAQGGVVARPDGRGLGGNGYSARLRYDELDLFSGRMDRDEQSRLAVVGRAVTAAREEIAPEFVAGDLALEPVLDPLEPVAGRVLLPGR